MIPRAVTTLLVVVACACGPRSAPAQVSPTGTDTTASEELPVGKGQLGQDNITVRLRSGATLDIRVLPLDERVMRLLANDAYAALRALTDAYGKRIDSIAASRGVRQPGLALVSFFGLAASTRFDPEVLTLSSRNRSYRPIGIIPLTSTFSSQQLDAGGSASGLIIYEERLPVTEPFTVSYLDAVSEEWERRLPRLETERGRILGTNRAARPAGGS